MYLQLLNLNIIEILYKHDAYLNNTFSVIVKSL